MKDGVGLRVAMCRGSAFNYGDPFSVGNKSDAACFKCAAAPRTTLVVELIDILGGDERHNCGIAEDAYLEENRDEKMTCQA